MCRSCVSEAFSNRLLHTKKTRASEFVSHACNTRFLKHHISMHLAVLDIKCILNLKIHTSNYSILTL